MLLLNTTDRRLAKNCIFLKVYGGGPSKLAATASVSLSEATRIYNELNNKIPGLEKLRQAIISKVLRTPNKVLRTLYGHNLVYPYIDSYDSGIRSQAERQYFNGIIQGTQADIIKIVMAELYHQHQVNTRLGAILIMQIHDELVFEVPEGNAPILCDVLMRVCNNNKHLLPGLPVTGTPGIGHTWKEAKLDGEAREKK